METFELTLINEKVKTYRLIVLLIIILNALFVVYFLLAKTSFSKGIAGFVIFADVIFSALSILSLKKSTFIFSKLNIEKKFFPAQKYKWNDLTNVILKDNILTLDFKSNKILQAEIENTGFNEDAFNTFAKAQLNK